MEGWVNLMAELEVRGRHRHGRAAAISFPSSAARDGNYTSSLSPFLPARFHPPPLPQGMEQDHLIELSLRHADKAEIAAIKQQAAGASHHHHHHHHHSGGGKHKQQHHHTKATSAGHKHAGATKA